MVDKDNVCAEEKGAEQVAIAAKGTENKEGCPDLGSAAPKKFKDADALARAYGALEAEFTRRSQRIKELEKEVETLKSGSVAMEGSGAEKLRKNAETRRTAAKAFDRFVQGLGQRSGDAPSEKDGQGQTDVEKQAEGKDAPSTEAKEPCVQPLVSVVKGAGTAESALETADRGGEGSAVKEALEESGKALSVVGGKTELSSDELYARVSGDEKVRLKIIGEYLSSLGKSAPPLTAGGVGAMLAPPLRAKSIADAGNLALQYLKKPFEL